ncbi:Alpha/beta hydrolase family [Rubrobacter radiotolerans]|uniref:Alpha/beta fold hydrolase n=1 Tax=Rubrobacter radiotolerans TaxID=42256 RepID=A0A023X6G1_RUBRA|nr:alpha/beta fold hydrolase [Rubrobacter radiotolerans]AHY47816.1 Alpha/beta hydrolase family [Rubrobacter radiotolerans]MDX5892455.1 alpha/beta fold hydrolase [Rubrobacter radiotolerans]SMC07746.1 Pimeloyl-ACP methyl ester carboxylesterase [Rubrobacter radiotolerans DSM 5868]
MRSGSGLFLGGLAALAGAVGALALLNRTLQRAGGDVRLPGERRHHRWEGHDLAYTVLGEGPPLVLAHGIYAGASSAEFRRNVEELSQDFKVYALDLLGAGASEKPARRYEPRDVAGQLENFAKEVVGSPTHLVASSLTAALALPAVVRNPRLFKKLVLICPTGYRGALDRPSGRLGDALYGAFRLPVVGDALYHALVSRRGIRFYLERTAYHDPKKVTETVVEEHYRAGHGPGAKYLPAAFASGKLNLGVGGYWPRVANRTMIVWGQQAKEPTPAALLKEFLGQNPRTAYRIFRNAALLPHVERADTFNREVRDFLTNRV